jgi:hypothetical protein
MATMDALYHEGPPAGAGRGLARPFRTRSDDLVAMFQTPDAGTATWHRTRARSLLREAKLQPVAAVSDAWWRLAARHLATAQLLEEQQGPVPAPPQDRLRRFRRSA